MRAGFKVGDKYFPFPVFAVFSILVFILIAYFNQAIRLLTFPFPVEYGEGVVANYIIRVMNGQSVYPDFSADNFIFLHNPYGPLFFYASAFFAKFFSNPFLSGRLLSLLSFFLIIIFLYLSQSRGFRCQRSRCGFSGIEWLSDLILERKSFMGFIFALAFFAGSPIVWRYSVMSRVDFFALAITAYSFYFLHLSERKNNDHVQRRELFLLFISGVLSGSAFLVKPLYLISAFSGIFVTMNSSFKRFAIFASGIITVMAIFFCWLFISDSYVALLVHWTKLNLIGVSFAQFAKLFFLFLRNHPFCFLYFFISLYKF